MRAIIVNDLELNALLDKLELEKMKHNNRGGDHPQELVDSVHRAFHYIVCKWIQEVGGEVKR